MFSSPSDKSSDMPPGNQPDESPENPSQKTAGPKKPRAKHLSIDVGIFLTHKAIMLFRDQYFEEGKINAHQVIEVSDVLREQGVLAAQKKLKQFMDELNRQNELYRQKEPDQKEKPDK